jgi:hypothetical protein
MNESNRVSTRSLPRNSREAEFFMLASEREKYSEQRRSLLFRLIFATAMLLLLNIFLVLNDDSWLSAVYSSITKMVN